MALGELCPPANPRTLRYTGAYFYLLPKKNGESQTTELPAAYYLFYLVISAVPEVWVRVSP